MAEDDIMRKIQIALSTVGARVFRNNVALAWAGKVYKPARVETVTVGPNDVVIRNARPIHAGLIEGASDLIGWSHDGRFVACEVKEGQGRTTKAQDNFINAVKAAGGIGMVARSNEEALQKYGEDTNGSKQT